MKQRTIQRVVVVVGLLTALTGVCAAGAAEASAYDLCIEYSPSKAGTVAPKIGTHRFKANSVVTLSADPMPGYQFAYWIGDVSDPASRQTTVLVDGAKIVVAVFRSAQDDGIERKLPLGGGGGGKLMPTLVDLQSPGFGLSGGPSKAPPAPIPTAPVPEPTTIALLGLGALAALSKRR